MPSIVYKEIPGWSGYRAGSDGTIWTCKNGRWGLLSTWRQMKTIPGNHNYMYVMLSGNGQRRNVCVHTLILESFVGPRPNEMECCHGNNNRQDNRLDNLRWDTPKSNQLDRSKFGTGNNGSKHGLAVLTETDVLELRMLHDVHGVTATNLGKRFKIHPNHAAQIYRREIWKHI